MFAGIRCPVPNDYLKIIINVVSCESVVLEEVEQVFSRNAGTEGKALVFASKLSSSEYKILVAGVNVSFLVNTALINPSFSRIIYVYELILWN